MKPECRQAPGEPHTAVVSRDYYGENQIRLQHPSTYYRICIYDPGHFTPYYNAGLCTRFAALGHPCELITSPEAFEPVPPAGAYRVRYAFFPFLGGALGRLLRYRPTLRRICKGFAYPLGIWRTWIALRRQEPGVFHIHFSVFPSLDAILVQALARRGWRIIYTLQEPHPSGPLNRWRYARLIRAASRVCMHSEPLAARLRELFPWAERKIVALTHGADIPALPSAAARRQARAALGVTPDQFLLLFFGMIKPYKGLEDLLDAMPGILQRFPNTRLLIAGEPLMNMRPVMERIAALPEGAVILRLGFVPQAEVENCFAAADLVVAAYRAIAASAVVLQAQGYGCPVLATPIGALPALLENGRCGILAGPDLAASIVSAIAAPDQLQALARAGRQRLEQVHSWEAVAEETLRLYALTEAAADARRSAAPIGGPTPY